MPMLQDLSSFGPGMGDTFDMRTRQGMGTFGTQQQQTQQQQQTTDQSNLIDQLKALVGADFSTDHLKQILAQLNSLGIKVQNQKRGDPRPRFLLPDGTTWDFGPGGWVNRGNMGDWDAAYDGGGGGGGGGIGGSAQDASRLDNIPGFQFAMQQGLQGINRNAAAAGTLLTGGTLKRLQLFGSQFADQTFQRQVQDALNRTKLGVPPPPA